MELTPQPTSPLDTAASAPALRGSDLRLQNLIRRMGLEAARALNEVASRRAWRRPILGVLEAGLAFVSITVAVALIYAGEFGRSRPAVLVAALVLVATKLLASVVTGASGGRWRYVGIRDAATIIRSALLGGGAGLIILYYLPVVTPNLRLVAADTATYILLACGLRLSVRWLHEWARRTEAGSGAIFRRALIVGAGEAGSMLIKSILASPKMLMEPVAVVDDDSNKHGDRLHGVPIVGSVDDLAPIAQECRADEIIIAIPSATGGQVGRVVDACVATQLPFRVAPDPEDVLGVRPGSGALRGVQAGDLLGRAQVDLNVGELRAELHGARVLITGAAGSIGSELTRQLLKFRPAVLYLVDRNENDLYFLRQELDRKEVQVPHEVVIQDIRDRRRLARVFHDARPTHVFHAAAFKHVPLMESHLVQAVENNILGTWQTLHAAREAGARKFVLISTDKAVRPTSVMGATKRFVEVLVSEATAGDGDEMEGVIVRFGNVLGSNGSVIPLFERQIAEGGPLTVTSREATRYFMTTSEAAQLVLQAASLKESAGKVAILDMGTPVRIWDLAERLIRMHGLRPGADIEIVEIGLRPGEKLHEELWWEHEIAARSSHAKIMLAEVGSIAGGAHSLIPQVSQLVDDDDSKRLHQLLKETVGLSNGTAPCAHGGDAAAAPKLSVRHPLAQVSSPIRG